MFLTFSVALCHQVKFPLSDFLPEQKLKELAELLPSPVNDEEMNTDEDPTDTLEVYRRCHCIVQEVGLQGVHSVLCRLYWRIWTPRWRVGREECL